MNFKNIKRQVIEHKLLVILVIITCLIAFYFYRNYSRLYKILNSPAILSNFFNSMGIFGPILMFLFVITEIVIAPIPGFVFTIAGAISFGVFWGMVIAYLGNLSGAIISFFLARRYGRGIIEHFVQRKKLKKFDRFMTAKGRWLFFVIRVNPLTSHDILNYIGGLSGMKFKDFLIASALAVFPILLFLNYFGSKIVGMNPTLYAIFLIISLISLLASFYVIYIAQRIKKRSMNKK